MRDDKLVFICAFELTKRGEMSPAFSPYELSGEAKIKQLAVDLTAIYDGVIAWGRSYDSAKNRYGPPAELIRYGVVPDFFARRPAW